MMRPTHNFAPENLEDEIVRLTLLHETDFEALYQVAADPEIWEQHPAKDRYQRPVFQQYFDGAVASGTAFLIYDKKDNQLIGCTRFYDFDAENNKVAIGYTFLAKEYWGGHYNRAVKTLLMNYAFNYVNTVIFHIGADNIRSQKALLKLGAVKVGGIEMDHYGDKLLHFEYAIGVGEFK